MGVQMIYALSIKILGIGPMGCCFGPGQRYRGVRALFKREPTKTWGLNLFVVSFSVRGWA